MQSKPVLVNLGMPCYRSYHPDTVASLARLLIAERDRIRDVIILSNMYIDKARNQIAKRTADNPDVTHLLWIDDDHVFGGDVFARLLSHNVPAVGALYFGKVPPFHAVAGFLRPGGPLCYRPLDRLNPGLQQVDILGMGCTLIAADLLRGMREHFGDENWFCSQEGGEDLHFFDRCRQMGVPVHLDGDLVVGHMGEQCIADMHWKAMRPQSIDPESPQGVRPDFEDVYADAVARLPKDRPSVVVEVGSYLGRSAIVMADQILASQKPVCFCCVDTFKGSDGDDEHAHGAGSVRWHKDAAQRGGGSFRAEFEKNLEKARVRHLVNVIEADSAEGADKFPPASVDFCFIDAAHEEEAVRRDILAWMPKMRPGGVLAGHDLNWPGVAAAVKDLLPDAEPRSRASWWYEVPV